MSRVKVPWLDATRLRYLRLRPFDTSSADGRSSERYRLAALGATANLVARLSSMLLMVLTVHWAAPYLGPERFGVWATFASLAAMLSFLDLGVGNALVNRIAHASASNDDGALRRTASGGVGWLAVIGAASAVLLALVAAAVPWGRLFKLGSAAASDEARWAAFAFAAIFGLHLFGSGLLKILIGQQRSHEAHAFASGGALLACAALWLVTRQSVGVPGLLIVGFGFQALAALSVLGLLYRRGTLRGADVARGMHSERDGLLRTGSLFLLLQIGTMIGWGGDTLLLASLGGAVPVASFAVATRLFQFASQPVAVFNAPLWAAYADASARGDRAFLRQTLQRSMLLSVAAAAVISLGLLLVGPWLVAQWTADAITVPFALLAALAVWAVFEAFGAAFGAYLNGVGVVREQVMVVLAFCAVALPLKVVATLHAGALGLVLATTVAYLCTVVLLYATFLRRHVLYPLQEPLA